MNHLKKHIGKLGTEALKLIDAGFHFERVGDDVAQERLAICDACEHKQGSQCGICGCELDFKISLATNPTKIGFKKTKNKCPKGRW